MNNNKLWLLGCTFQVFEQETACAFIDSLCMLLCRFWVFTMHFRKDVTIVIKGWMCIFGTSMLCSWLVCSIDGLIRRNLCTMGEYFDQNPKWDSLLDLNIFVALLALGKIPHLDPEPRMLCDPPLVIEGTPSGKLMQLDHSWARLWISKRNIVKTRAQCLVARFLISHLPDQSKVLGAKVPERKSRLENSARCHSPPKI